MGEKFISHEAFESVGPPEGRTTEVQKELNPTRREFLARAGRIGVAIGLADLSFLERYAEAHPRGDLRRVKKEQEGEVSHEYIHPPEIEKRGVYDFMGHHNWALYSWSRAMIEERIRPSGNRIIHVDAHHDLGYPIDGVTLPEESFWRIFHDPKASREEKYKALEEETRHTSISKFVMKAVGLGLSDEVDWVRPRWDNPTPRSTAYEIIEEHIFDESGRDRGVILRSQKLAADENVEELRRGGKRILRVNEITADQILGRVQPGEGILFDVDLDYFSCYEQGAPEWIPCTGNENTPNFLGPCSDPAQVKDGKVRNPFVAAHRATRGEYRESIEEIRRISDQLPTTKSFRTAASSPGFLFEDQKEDIVKTFFGGSR